MQSSTFDDFAVRGPWPEALYAAIARTEELLAPGRVAAVSSAENAGVLWLRLQQ